MPRLICPNCSNAYTPTAATGERCPRCGYGAAPAAPSWSVASGPASFAPAMSPPGPSLSPPGQVYAPAQATTNGFAITSMVLGIVSIPLFFLGTILGLLALIFGIVAVNQIKKRNQRGFGMAVTGIVLGSTMLIAWAFLFSFFLAFF